MKKILLLHGWNNDNYTSKTKSRDAWHNRRKFVDKLSKKYEVYKLNFPGFCGEAEPKEKEWTLNDYASYVYDYLFTHNLKVDYIVGYSFGGAVAIRYNRMFDNKQKLILISPAIIRNAKKSVSFIKTPKSLDGVRKKLRDWYLVNIVKNEYMIDGDEFLNNSYQNIVRENLIEEVKDIIPSRLSIIYGANDNMVNPNVVINELENKFKIFILDGDHDIANTNTKELVSVIEDLIENRV